MHKINENKLTNNNLFSSVKFSRILCHYTKLMNGDAIRIKEEAAHFNVSNRTISRDLEDLAAFLHNQMVSGGEKMEIYHDKRLRCHYLLRNEKNALTNSEILAVCKILLDSRAFRKEDMSAVLSKLLNNCVPKQNQKLVNRLIANELEHYIEPRHGKKFIGMLWDIGEAIYANRMLKIRYGKLDGTVVERIVKPAGLMFSEFYFYLTAFIEDIDREKVFDNAEDTFPTIYRIDRIQSFEVLAQRFTGLHKDRFEEGEFRKRVQFMYGGKLRRIKFKFIGTSIEAVLDRLPTAKVLEITADGYVVTAEVFGEGVEMWIRSQGDRVEMMQ
ncbi:MAG: WYL domain-containing protein [Oscillospiraceae bacterium]